MLKFVKCPLLEPVPIAGITSSAVAAARSGQRAQHAAGGRM